MFPSKDCETLPERLRWWGCRSRRGPGDFYTVLQLFDGALLFVSVVYILIDVEADVSLVRSLGDKEEDEEELEA